MISIDNFLRKVISDKTARFDQALAVLWYQYKYGEEKNITIREIAKILEDRGYGRPNVTNLRESFKSKFIVRGRKESYSINEKNVNGLNKHYNSLLDVVEVDEYPSIFPQDLSDAIQGHYIKSMMRQINTSYNSANYDCVAVMVRRLMESLIIETYVFVGRDSEIKNKRVFYMLDGLINKIINDHKIILSRDMPKNMQIIKGLGDTAAHDRNYITTKPDIDDNKTKFRKVIIELLKQSGCTV